MKIADIMSKNLEWLTEGDSVQQAATIMAEAGVGFLPICDKHHRVIGVVTDRDLTTRALAKNIAPATTSAALVMSAPAITCLDTANVHDAEALMAKERKARLVIVDANEKLTGTLSLADLVMHAPRQETLDTVRAVLWRDALGPRGGATRDVPLFKDDPIALARPVPDDEVVARATVFTGGHRQAGTKEFPG